MLRFWLVVLFLSTTSVVWAANDRVFENCGLVGALARQIMTDRQLEVDQSTAIELATASPDLRELSKGIAEVAYSFPTYQTPDLRDQAVAEFGESLQLACEKKRQIGDE